VRADPGGRSTDGAKSREWLLHCEGFRVEGPDGFVGIVVGVEYEFSARWDRPSGLAVRAATGGSLTVPIETVTEVSEVEGTVLVKRLPDSRRS
jgi:hypothetical protein